MAAQRVSFVRAGEGDWKNVLRVELDSKSKTYASFVTEKEVRDSFRKSNVFFIKSGEELIGTVSFDPEKDGTVYLANLAILPEHKGKGLGTEAMDLLMEKVEDLGFKKATLRVHPKNTPALLIYLKSGFEIVRWEENSYGDGEPRLFLEKNIK